MARRPNKNDPVAMAEHRAYQREWQRKWRLKNPERWAEIRKAACERRKPQRAEEAKRWRAKNPAIYKRSGKKSRLMKSYGLTLEQEEAIYVAQNGKCPICDVALVRETGVQVKSVNKSHVDHDHKSGNVRGLLCATCNLLLGYAKDSIEVLQAAIEYLRNNKPVKAK